MFASLLVTTGSMQLVCTFADVVDKSTILMQNVYVHVCTLYLVYSGRHIVVVCATVHVSCAETGCPSCKICALRPLGMLDPMGGGNFLVLTSIQLSP